ncbi:zinc finger family protein [Arabidopsis lyrata subsp. lyrata]|uniref:RING-type E3 ubiquitin transferase n=1 Tax=Arabidopsis lyrata subsp. lyrata TaxID=81972 RepID=D7L3X6_ARALL|nr:E3 ubiquitin-protein ligase RNF165 [Arabidopsis lyrata subsp. lyrata]EFH61322.1 zinc finger family protein [Arabidopsis lyrata subsp. lyrata]|eukprot:XP_002885063.1 E3 ubiquitin-protein ligase RNF165 [Arabidopsis lyrata subsp. lyrata]
MVFDAVNPDPDSFVYYDPIYNDEGDFRRTQNLTFIFHVCYNLAPEVNSDGEEEDVDNLETLIRDQTQEFDKELLFSGDREQIQVIVYHLLDLIKAPRYSEVVRKLIDAIFDLKERDKISNVMKVDVVINVIVWRFPDDDDDDDDVDVKLEVAPASNEAIEQHLETVVVENDGYCVICMDTIRVGSDMAAGRMPCSHVFHRTCAEDWLRSSGICPVCRAMFPF